MIESIETVELMEFSVKMAVIKPAAGIVYAEFLSDPKIPVVIKPIVIETPFYSDPEIPVIVIAMASASGVG